MGKRKKGQKKQHGGAKSPEHHQPGDTLQHPPAAAKPTDVPESEKISEAPGSQPRTPERSSNNKGDEPIKTRTVDRGSSGVSLADGLQGSGEGASGGGHGGVGERADREGKEDSQVEYRVQDLDEEKLEDMDMIRVGLYMCLARLEAVGDKHKDPNAESVTTGLSGQQRKEIRTMGIREEKLKEIAKNHLYTRISHLDGDEQIVLMKDLWDEGLTRDSQLLAIHLLTHLTIPLSRNVGFEGVFELMEHFLTVNSAWDTVGMLAERHVNALAYLEPAVMREKVEEWIKNNKQPWLQVAALLNQSCLGRFTNKDKLFEHCGRFFNLQRNAPGFEEICHAIDIALMKYVATGGTPLSSDEKTSKIIQKLTVTPKDEVLEFIKKNLDIMSPGMNQRMKKLHQTIDDTKHNELVKS